MIVDERFLTPDEWRNATRWSDREFTWHFFDGSEWKRYRALTVSERACVKRKPTPRQAKRADGTGMLTEMTVDERRRWGDRVQYARMKYAQGEQIWYGDGLPEGVHDDRILPPLNWRDGMRYE